jgi:F0F1-type ATP synthase beta subunit
MNKTKTQTDGVISQIIGAVVDVRFAGSELPAVLDAITVGDITLEVASHLDHQTVRTISLSTTDGLRRGDKVVATGAPISTPVGEAVLGRMLNLLPYSP